MIKYKEHIFKESKNEKPDGQVTFIGLFGEDLTFTLLPDGTYIFSSQVLNLWDVLLPDVSKEQIIDAYCVEGNKDFNPKKGIDRLSNLGRVLRYLYDEFLITKDDSCLRMMNEIIGDAEEFKVSKTEYIDWFITFGSVEDRDYIRYILSLRRALVRTKMFKYDIHAIRNNPTPTNKYIVYRCIARSERKAMHYIKTQHKNEFKEIDFIKKGDAIYMALNKYKVEFTVNGRRSETIVSAADSFYARELVKAQYNGSKVVIIKVTRI